MNRPTFVRSRPSAVVPTLGCGFGLSIVLGARRGLLKVFARAIWPASRERNAESHVHNPESIFPLSHSVSSLPPLPDSHAAGLVPRAGRTLYSPRLTMGGMATAACLEW